jgi:ubiquinone/menaquinone biosynthesis C-methylase UbiE
MRISPSSSVTYRSFGFIPSGSLRADLKGRLFGAPNLFKRLQARDIMTALDIRPGERVLDFGCGSGYFTIEMAKLAGKAYGIDVNSHIRSIVIPPALQGRLEYIVGEGQRLPFPDGHFERVLASEVLQTIADPADFLTEIKRVLKPGGRLVVVNGAGHPAIRNAYRSSSRLLRFLKRVYPERMPSSYEEYCSILQASFRNAQRNFLTESEIRHLLQRSGFVVVDVSHSPGYLAGTFLSWSQFLHYLRTGRTLSQRNFPVNYLLFSLVRLFERGKHEGGLLCIAER